eukprot:Em0001g1045a
MQTTTRRSLKKGDIWNSKVLQNTEQSSITLEKIGLSTEEIKGKDLCLIQMPKDLDVHTLDGIQLELENNYAVSIQDHSLQINVLKQSGSQSQLKSVVLVPTSKPGKLRAIAGIRSQLLVSQSTATPKLPLPPPGAPKGMEIPAGLKQRWKPFGSGEGSSPGSLAERISTAEHHDENVKRQKVKKSKLLKSHPSK